MERSTVEDLFVKIDRIKNLVDLFDRADDRDERDVSVLTCWLADLLNEVERDLLFIQYDGKAK